MSSHGGGGICEVIGRLNYAYELQEEAYFLGPYAPMKIKHEPGWYLKKMYFDTVTYHAPAAQMVIDTVGVDHVLYGSDAPPLTSLKPRAIKLIEDLDIPAADKAKIFGGNAARLLKLNLGTLPRRCVHALRSRAPCHECVSCTSSGPCRPVRRVARLDAARLLHQLLDRAGDRQRKPGLVGHLGHHLHVLERPGERDHVPFLQRVGGAGAHHQRVAQLHEIDAGGLGEPAGLDQPDGVHPQQQVVHGLADLAVADVAEMRIVGAERRIDRAPALDHVGLAADQREQRALVGGEAAAADRGVEHADALRLRSRGDLLHDVRRGGGRHRDDRAFAEVLEQAIRAVDHRIDLVGVADAEDHEIALFRQRGRRRRGRRASVDWRA